MTDFSEKWGKDVEIATALALEELKCSREEVEVIVLEEPTRGFLGIGSKLAKVRVEKKKPIKRKKEEIENKKAEESEIKVNKAVDTRVQRPVDLKEVKEHEALDFLLETTKKMGLSLTFKAYLDDAGDNIYIDIEGKDAGAIIGKRGQTLDAIQYLTSLVVNKNNEKYLRVVLDAENYRAKREKTLQQLANRLADKVVRTKKYVRLEPMNPYERMVIHAALVDNPNVVTKSEGEEPYRRIIITLK